MRGPNLVGPIIIAIGLVISGLGFAVVGALLQVEDGGALVRLNRAEVELRAARADQAEAEAALAQAKAEVTALRAALAAAPTEPASTVIRSGPSDVDEIFEHDDTVAMTEEMILTTSRFNGGITQPRNRVMREVLGQPRAQYGTDCQSVTNPSLKALMETRQIGPIRVTMIKPALDSLERIMRKLQDQEPDIYASIGTAGALCVRLIRGSRSSISNHSWGTAIDLKLQGRLDGFGDGSTQFGLLLIAELFNEEGWFWGATYSREDSMHFEVGVETLQKWASEGLL
ncbi:M15 family metallopeptidase [Yoonia sediminilitoris]|uniref:D-alanyl-D-alanine carboxypeptidase-like protein n=1 Tax=Yoonia sediminilitoris TaxID=1286148 RepID=A0A2T6KM67_9RHOB|nr:M15 family metallopeptidase [Yoonia sediminilitoris]PUB17284.1 D-alanyl-D-alanine carboxypeptidase-like protein [Yoonia sediminilitoris]RCW97579.1 D-alanyl-D-alanine carboxypeptidase-like protein [Yoonia sediminilitoris]